MVNKFKRDYVLQLGFQETIGERRVFTRAYFPPGNLPREYRITVIETIAEGRLAIAIPPVGTLNNQEKEEALAALRKEKSPKTVAKRYPTPS